MDIACLFNCVTLCITQRYGHRTLSPFKNAWFERFARKNRISDKALREVVELADKGLISADLGSGVIKQRLARRGGGKSGGYRTIIFYRVAEKAFFIYGKEVREKI
ncbi:type II toxin-antitoxin system RelE/ParE family toxin [Escherichia coli]